MTDSPEINLDAWLDEPTPPRMPRRKLYRADLKPDSAGPFASRREERTTDANVISSLADDGLHYPVIDVDLPCYVIPTSTPGHFHLYIDKGLTWNTYRALLIALATAGIVDDGYVDACLEREQSFARLPWVTKGLDPSELADEVPPDVDEHGHLA